MKKFSLWDRIRYSFDNMMARGMVAQVVALGLFTLLASAGFAVLVWGLELSDAPNFMEQFIAYVAFTLQADPMTGEPSWVLRVITFVIYLIAILITSVLIGLLGVGVEEKIESLRKGRSVVIEKGHVVILGWTPAIFPIISELVIANKNQKGKAIVVMADRDKVEMEEAIRENVEDTMGTRIVCRTGSPMKMADLELTTLNTARSILVLGTDSDDPDTQVIKTLLAITQNPTRRQNPYHIVVEVVNRKNVDLTVTAFGDEVELILPGEMISKIMAQTCRQPGLSAAYTDLLNFQGDEIYYKSEPGLVGNSFGDALLAYENSSVIGLIDGQGKPKLNPPMKTIIEEDDQIIAISEDDDTIRLSGLTDLAIKKDQITQKRVKKPSVENVLIIGWNPRGPVICKELDSYVPKGSTVMVVANSEKVGGQIKELDKKLKNVKFKFILGETTDRDVLDKLPYKDHPHIILLSYSGLYDVQKADAMTLMTLLQLRQIKEATNVHMSIVSEILDIRNQSLAEVTHADDFVVSDEVISLMMAQIAENKHLAPIFEDILDADGSELYIKSVSNYLKKVQPVNFYTIVEAARKRDQVAIGYRKLKNANGSLRSFEVVMNPKKSELIDFTQDDQVIVLAEG